MHFTITIRRGHASAAHGGRAHVPQLRLRPTSRCARLAPALDSRPRLTRVRAPPASALHPRPCYTRACAPGVLVPVGAATCLVFVSLAGLLLVRCSSSLVLLLVWCLFPCSVATAPVSVSLLLQVLVSVGGLSCWCIGAVEPDAGAQKQRAAPSSAPLARSAAESAACPLLCAVLRSTWVGWARERRRRENLTRIHTRSTREGQSG